MRISSLTKHICLQIRSMYFMQRKIYLCLILLSLISNCANIPKGVSGDQANKLKKSVMKAMRYKAFKEKTAAVSFGFSGRHEHFWDKSRSLSEVKWGDIVVMFHTRSFRGIAYKNGVKVNNENELASYIKDAHKKFINDTYWLNPAFHFNSPGVIPKYVAKDKLLITYSSGGVTPGDSYLFTLDKNFRILEMKMWVDVIPIPGLTAKFENYITTSTRFITAQHHYIGPLNVKLENLKAYGEYPGDAEDRFKDLVNQINL